jgi:hypothetical protein
MASVAEVYRLSFLLQLFFKKHATRRVAATPSTDARKSPCGGTLDGKTPITVRLKDERVSPVG